MRYDELMGLTRQKISDFRGGLNTLDAPFNIQPNESPEMVDVSLDQRGAIGSRLGRVRFDTALSPAAFPMNMRAWYPNSTLKYLLASFDNGSIYSYDTAGVGNSRVVGTAGAVWHMEQMTDINGLPYLFCANGINPSVKLNNVLNPSTWVQVPNNVYMMRVWKNRMVVAKHFSMVDSQKLFFSEIANPELFTISTDFIEVKGAEDDRDPITWLEVLGDMLIIFKRNSVWRLTGDIPNPLLQRIGSPGCYDRFQSAVSGGRVYYWNTTGLWSTDGMEAPRYEMTKVSNWIAENLIPGNSKWARVCAGRDQKIFVACSATPSRNNVLFELMTGFEVSSEDESEPRHPVLRHTLPCFSMCIYRNEDKDELMGGVSLGSGRIDRFFVGETDAEFGAPPSYLFTYAVPFEDEEPKERLRRLNLIVEGKGLATWHKDLDLTPGVYRTWDVTGQGIKLVRFRPEQRARYHSIFVGPNGARWKLYSIELVFRGGKEH